MEPYNCKNKIVIFGGHFDFVKKIKNYLPNVKIYQYEKSPNASIFKNIDAVFLQNRACCHPMFTNIVKNIKKNDNVKLYYFSFSSAQKCAEEVIAFDQNLKK